MTQALALVLALDGDGRARGAEAGAADGSAGRREQRRLEEELAAERAKRVEHIQYVAGKRIGNRLSRSAGASGTATGAERAHAARAQGGGREAAPAQAGAVVLALAARLGDRALAANAKLSLVEQVEKAKREAKMEAELLR